MEKCIIVAVADNYAIGKKNQLLWILPGDMRYFRETTTGSTVIMGWMTFQSIGRALPKRHNIVISEFPWPDAPSTVDVVASLPEAFTLASKDKGRCFVILLLMSTIPSSTQMRSSPRLIRHFGWRSHAPSLEGTKQAA